jgi:hypothetical protein
VLGLLRLPPEAIDHLRTIPGEQMAFYSERRLREIARMENRPAQLEAFQRLRQRVEGGN